MGDTEERKPVMLLPPGPASSAAQQQQQCLHPPSPHQRPHPLRSVCAAPPHMLYTRSPTYAQPIQWHCRNVEQRAAMSIRSTFAEDTPPIVLGYVGGTGPVAT